MKNSVWTDKKIEKLQKLYEKGLSTAEIGKKLEVSKNSVIGKIHRLGLSKGKTEVKDKKSTIKSIFGFMKKDAKDKDDEVKEVKTVKKTAKKTESKAEKTEKAEKTTKKAIKESMSNKKESQPKKDKEEEISVKKQEEKKVEKKTTVKEKSKESYTLQMLKSDMCKWPSEKPNKDGMFLFCGKKTESKQTYCPEHMKKAYLSQEEQKNKKANKDK